jgi:hypothetical protein
LCVVLFVAGLLVGCWSVLLFFGSDGYTETTRRVLATWMKVEEG